MRHPTRVDLYCERNAGGRVAATGERWRFAWYATAQMLVGPPFVIDAQGVNVTIKVKVRASRTRITGTRDGAVEIALAAPPVDGAANDELIRFLVDQTGVPKSRVTLVRGERSRTKVVRFHGADATVIELLVGAAG